MSKKDDNIAVYNKSAEKMKSKFNSIGARTADIDKVFSFCKANPSVLELGCGHGRDASYILEKTPSYCGIDYSEEFIKIAKENNPLGEFLTGDFEELSLPEAKYDVVFSSAAFVHTPKDVMLKLIPTISQSLTSGGILFVSTKATTKDYEELSYDNGFGIRHYSHYGADFFYSICSDYFDKVSFIVKEERGQLWLEAILKKK